MEKAKKVIITGDIDFVARKYVFDKVEKMTFWWDPVIVVNGGEGPRRIGYNQYAGAAHWGEEWAHKHRHLVMRFHLDKETYGDRALRQQIKEMTDFADYLILFTEDGLSKELNMLRNEAKRKGLKTKLFTWGE